ncbi:MAG: ATP-binding protein [Sulfolobales archaeon]|nr:ATP-binding protein [Sulfolobales archaeon]
MFRMDTSKFSKLLIAVILFTLNTTLSELLISPKSLMTLMATVNISYVLTFTAGISVGLFGDLSAAIAEVFALSSIYMLGLGINLDFSFVTHLLIPYFTGLALGSSFFRKSYIKLPKVVVGKDTLIDFFMILGSSLIALYFISDLPTINRSLFYITTSVGPKLYLILLGLVCNSFILSISMKFNLNSLESALRYLLMILVASLSWLTLPVIVLINSNYLIPAGNFLILGKIVMKVGEGFKPRYPSKGYVKVPIDRADNKHMVIVGMSGSGKSYLAMKLIKQLAGKFPILVIDPHGEYTNLARELKGRVLTPSEGPVNPLETLGKPKSVRAEEVSDMVRRIFKLGNVQKYSLYTLILNTYERLSGGQTPTFNDVYETLINYLDGGQDSKDVYLSKEVLNTLIPYLNLLRGPYLLSTSLSVEDLMNDLTVIDLSVVESDYVVGIYVESLLHLIETYVKTFSRPLFMVVDEAHRFMGGRVAPLLSKLVIEGRKFGLGLIIITQQPLDLEASIIANSAYVVSFAIQEPNNLNYISKLLCGSYVRYEVVRDLLMNLKKHEALIKIRDEGSLYIIKA